MGCSGSKPKPTRNTDNIEIFSSQQKLTAKDTGDGVQCQNTDGVFHLPGKKNEYEFNVNKGTHTIEVRKVKVKSLISTCNSRIKEQEDLRNNLNTDIKNKKDKDGSKADRVKDIDRNLTDYKTVRDILRDGRKGNHKLTAHHAKRGTSMKVGSGPAPKQAHEEVMDKDDLNPIVRKFTDAHYWKSYKQGDKLMLDLKNEDDKKGLERIIKQAEKSILPDFDQISVWGIQEDDLKNIRALLGKNFPKEVKELHLQSKDHLDLEEIWDEVQQCAPRVKENLRFAKFEIQKKTFEKIFGAYSHIEKLEFDKCDIESEGTKLPAEKYKITELVFTECGSEDFGNWEEDEDKLRDILAALSKTSLKTSLETIYTADNGIEVDDIEEIAEEFDLKADIEEYDEERSHE